MLAVLYDVHGNLPALDAVLADARSSGATEVLLGGDYSAFGAWPAETVARLEALPEPATWIRGNHERWALGGQPDVPPAPEVLGAIAHEVAALGPETVARLGALPMGAHRGRVHFAHAAPGEDMLPLGPEPADTDAALVARVDADLVVVGHTHLPFARTVEGVEVRNPGSVGFPFDGDPRAHYALLHDDGTFEPRRVAYDVARSAAALRAIGEPWALTTAHAIEHGTPPGG